MELTHQERLLVPSLNVRLELHRNSDTLLLHNPAGTTTAKLKVHEMYWYVRRVEPLKSLSLAVEGRLAKEAAKYPIRRVNIKILQVDRNRQNLEPTLISSGQLPRRVIFGLVGGEAYHGSLTKTPFKFDTFGLKEYSVIAGGTVYPRAPLTMDYANGLYTRAYLSLFDALGYIGGDKAIDITYEEYKAGYCIYAIDLSSDMQDSTYWHLQKSGSCFIKLDFTGAITEAVKVVVLLEYDNLIEISRNRIVTHDYEL